MKPVQTRYCLLFLAALAAVPVHAQSVGGFTLQPAPSGTPTPQAQGPADTRAGVQIAPRPVNTPTATPTPTPTPAASPLPTPAPSATASPVPSAGARPSPRPSATAEPRPTPTAQTAPLAAPSPLAEATPAPDSATADRPAVPALPTVAPAPSSGPATASPAPQNSARGTTPWLPYLALAFLLIVGGWAFALWRRRRGVAVPEIERPMIAAAPRAAALPLAESVTLRIDHDKLIRSAAFATLKYRMVLTNRTATPLTQLAVGIDLVSAHASVPVEDQIATAATPLEKRHDIARIGPHQSLTVEGQVQLPLAQAHVIRQGRHPLLVPLLRVRIEGEGEGALVKTFVVGQGAPGGARVQPFRLDEGPRSYAPIAQRELA